MNASAAAMPLQISCCQNYQNLARYFQTDLNQLIFPFWSPSWVTRPTQDGRFFGMPQPKKSPKKPLRYNYQVAKHFGVHPTTISLWYSQGCPRPAKGEPCDVDKIAVWRERNKGKDVRVQHLDAAAPTSKRALEEQLLEHKTALARIKVKEAEGKLIEREEMQERLRSIAIAIKRVLLTADEHLTPRLIGLQEREMKTVIKRFMRETCERLAKI